jgi:DeoR family transcriptional regulator, suf operon transcriptional repressor
MPTRRESQREPATSERFAGAASLLGTARGQILSELCGRRLTATELAERFAVSSNAVRTHLTALRHARLVRHESEARGVGKPTHVYELTQEGQYLLSRAYAPALGYLLGAARTLLADRIVDLAREAGRELASARRPRADRNASPRGRAEECAAILRSLGGSAEVVEDGDEIVIRSECCPLASVVTEHPAACKLLEGMAREITGRDVREHCERARRPHCRFVIS